MFSELCSPSWNAMSKEDKQFYDDKKHTWVIGKRIRNGNLLPFMLLKVLLKLFVKKVFPGNDFCIKNKSLKNTTSGQI